MTRADKGKPGWSDRHEQIERIGEKLTELWLSNSKLNIAQLLIGAEPGIENLRLYAKIVNVDEDFEWALDHYNDDPPGGN
jgi:hypothetical protein